MNELSRLAYLEAMGINSYVSRQQLPGAATTRRLVVRRKDSVAATSLAPSHKPAKAEEAAIPRFDIEPRAVSDRANQSAAVPEKAETTPTVRFNLAAVAVGGFIWLEELAGRPLAQEQVHLMHAMARAVSPEAANPKVAQFDWPMHNNQQLDLGEDAARSSVASFLSRRMQQLGCTGLILLGEACQNRVPLEQFGSARIVRTVSAADMLSRPTLKKQAGQDLLPLVAKAR